MRSFASLAGDALRRSWIVLLCVLVSIGVALALTSRQEARYEADATWVVAPATEIEDPSDLLRSLETLERRTIVATFARLPATRPVRVDLAERMGLDESDLRGYGLRGSVVPYTNMIRFIVEGPDPERAAEAANALAREIRTAAASLYRIYTLREVEPATAPRRAVHPDFGRSAVVGALIGLFVGIGLALLPAVAPGRDTGAGEPPEAGTAP